MGAAGRDEGGAAVPPRQGPGDVAAALQRVWDIGDELDSNATRSTAMHVADEFRVAIDCHNRISGPVRNANEALIDQLATALETWRTVAESRLAIGAVPQWIELLTMTDAALKGTGR